MSNEYRYLQCILCRLFSERSLPLSKIFTSPLSSNFRKKESVEIRISLEEIMKLVRRIEEDMYKAFKDTSHRYKAKYRTLMFNLKDPRNKVSDL